MGHGKERLDENRDKCVAVTSSGKLVFLLSYYFGFKPTESKSLVAASQM